METESIQLALIPKTDAEQQLLSGLVKMSDSCILANGLGLSDDSRKIRPEFLKEIILNSALCEDFYIVRVVVRNCIITDDVNLNHHTLILRRNGVN